MRSPTLCFAPVEPGRHHCVDLSECEGPVPAPVCALAQNPSFTVRRAAHERRQPPAPPFTSTTETVVWSLITHTPQSHGRKTAITLTETRLQLLQRVRDVATLIRRCWCRRDAKHTRGACLGGRDRLRGELLVVRGKASTPVVVLMRGGCIRCAWPVDGARGAPAAARWS